MKICLWSDSTFVTKEIYFEIQWYEECFAANHLHDALKPTFAKRLCPNDFFGEVKCPGGSTVLLKTFSLQCYRSKCICFVPISCLWVSAIRGYEPINTKNASFMCFNSYLALVQAIYRWIFSAQNTRGQSEQCRIFSASNGRQDQFRCNQL